MSDNLKLAECFRQMAYRIEQNSSEPFGGAAVIVPPATAQGAEAPIEILILDSHGDVAQFLSTVITRVQSVAQKIDDRAKGIGWGR